MITIILGLLSQLGGASFVAAVLVCLSSPLRGHPARYPDVKSGRSARAPLR